MSRLTVERLNELYSGTLALVAEHGYDRLTMDQIAEATKSSKATLYRQWGNKSALVVEAMRCNGQAEEEIPDTGTLRGDLLALADRDTTKNRDDSNLITAIMHAMRANQELADAVRSEVIEPALGRVGIMIQRAVERGEVAADNRAIPFVNLLLMAPLVLSALLEGDDPDPAYLHRYFEGVLLPALGIH